MTALYPVNVERIMDKWRIVIEFARVFNFKAGRKHLKNCLQRMSKMAYLTVGDNVEWEGIKKNFVNSGASSKSRIIAIQRMAKEYAVGMDDAEVIVDRWRREYQDTTQKDR
jgi:hypothetical protein